MVTVGVGVGGSIGGVSPGLVSEQEHMSHKLMRPNRYLVIMLIIY